MKSGEGESKEEIEKAELEKKEIADLNKDKEQLNNDIVQLNEDIAAWNESIASLNGSTTSLRKDVEAGRCFHVYLDPESYSSDLLIEGLAKFSRLDSVIRMNLPREENTARLNEFIENTKTELEKDNRELEVTKTKLKEKVSCLEAKVAELKDTVKRLEMKLKRQEGKTGVVTHPKMIDPTESGLEYVQASHRIGIVSATTDDRKNIGLVQPAYIVTNRTLYILKTNIPNAPVYDELETAWSELQLGCGETPLENEDFVNKLVVLVPELDEVFVRNAWHVSQVEYEIGFMDHASELALQQLVYSPLSLLFMAAAGGCNNGQYKADEFISASLSVMSKQTDADNYKASKISIKPDAAVTLMKGSDAYGVMEIRACASWCTDLYFADNDKCVITTAVTAIVARKCIEEEYYKEVAVPFVVAAATMCFLYVTILDEQGNPCIRVVQFPKNSGHAGPSHCDESKSDFFDADTTKKYERLFAECKVAVNNLPSISFGTKGQENDRKSSTGSDDSTGSDSSSRGHILPSGRTKEDDAIDAAACGGKFCNVEYPFDRFLRFTDSGVVMDEQVTSPFYFKARPVPSANLTTVNKVFLKLWRVEDIDVGSVEHEWMCHQIAFKAGVPVAAPVLPDVAKYSSESGSEHLIFVVEYIDQDPIESLDEIVQFCDSLIDTVMKLHDKAGLLHCDLKPGNIRWRNGVVRLIDFGRAQRRDNAIWIRGTKGFEATEILNELPCSTKTDAFSVGRIILQLVDELENVWQSETTQEKAICNMLHGVGENLVHSDPEARLLLTDAFNLLQGYKGDDQGSPLTMAPKLDETVDPVTT